MILKEEEIKISWMCNSRVDLIDEESVILMKQAGCTLISLGAESGSQKVLDRAKKTITLDESIEVVRLCRKYGIISLFYFIFGLPGETKDTIKESIDFILKLEPDYIQVWTATPFPGTGFYEEAISNNWITEKDYSNFFNNNTSSVVSYPDLSGDEITEAVKLAYSRFYFRPIRVLKQIYRLSSIQNIKSNIKMFKSLLNVFR